MEWQITEPAEHLTPRLRALDLDPVLYDGREFILVRDPLGLSDQVLLVPQPLALALAFMDGTRDSFALDAHLGVHYGFQPGVPEIAALVNALDMSLLLQNQRFAKAERRALLAYRDAPYRPPRLAGESYPADPAELKAELAELVQQMEPEPPSADGIRGVISPHIDYARGGGVYAQVWSRAAQAVRDAELVILLGTDHYGSDELITLTRQDYATPLGVLPTHQAGVDALAEALGGEAAFAGELRHRSEHSIELAAVWLHYVLEGRPVPMLPILCGSFQRFLDGSGDPEEDPVLQRTLAALRELMSTQKTVVVAAGDLAHVGPAFAGEPLDDAGKQRLREADEALLEQICAGDPGGFFGALKAIGDSNNVCGLAPIYLALRLLSPGRGVRTGYELCPADGEQTSVVSICGALLFDAR